MPQPNPYNYQAAADQFGDQFTSQYRRNEFKRLRRQFSDPAGALQSRFSQPQAPAQFDPNNPIPQLQPFDWMGQFAGKRYTTRNLAQAEQNFTNWDTANQETYRNALNSYMGQSGPMNDPALIAKLQAPVISDELLEQNIARGSERVTMEQDAIEQALRSMLASSGQRPDSIAPGLAGARFMTAFRHGQQESDLRTGAATTNAEGLRSGVNGMAALNAGKLQMNEQFMKMLENLSGANMRGYSALRDIVGTKSAKGKNKR